jgi:hypothetical protein
MYGHHVCASRCGFAAGLVSECRSGRLYEGTREKREKDDGGRFYL